MNCGDCSLRSVVAFALASRHPGPYRTSLALCHAIALLTFVASTATGDLSQVDRLWSILPALYAWMVLPVVDARTTLMACLATAWSARLTYNFHRRGGYGAWPRVWRGEEDYRWGVLRSGALGGRWLAPLADARIMAVFNAVFISLFQNYLLLYIASPSLFVWSMATGAACCHADGGGGGGGMASHSGTGRAAVPPSMPLNVVDCIASVLFVASLAGETVADNQQRAFQNGKRAWRLANLTTRTSAGLCDAGGGGGVGSSSPHPPSSIERQYDDGFCQSGLFAIVRKPAYAFEQLVWISYHLFSVAAAVGHNSNHDDGHSRYRYWNWSAGGCVLLCLLFQASGWLTEEISMSKYPAYRKYRERVPLYVPRISSLRRLIRAGIAPEDREKDE